MDKRWLSRHVTSRQSWLLGALLVVACTVAYLPAINAGFLWDDAHSVTQNPHVVDPAGLRDIWFAPQTYYYLPISYSTHWLEYRLWGNQPMGYHVVNIGLHALGCLLVWRMLERYQLPLPWFCALIFAVHPVNAESVAWITERRNLLALIFFCLCALSFRNHLQHQRGRSYWASVAYYVLALLSKPSVLLLPLVLAGYQRFCWRESWRKVCLSLLPFAAFGLLAAISTVVVENHVVIQDHVIQEGGMLVRTLIACQAVLFYVWKAVWPTNLCMPYAKWVVDASHPSAYVSLVALLVLAVLAYQYRRSWGKCLLFYGAYLVLMLAPVLGFIPTNFHRYTYVADHWQHLALLGTIAFAVWLVTRSSFYARHHSRVWFRGAAAGLVLVLAARTWVQASVYRDLQSFSQYTVATNPDAWLARMNLATCFTVNGEPERAVAECEEALATLHRLKEDRYGYLVFVQLARAHVASGDYDRAQRALDEALELYPGDLPAHVMRGRVLGLRGEWPEAADQLLWVVEHVPEETAAQQAAIDAIQKLELAERLPCWQRMLAALPNHADVRFMLSRDLHASGDVEASAESLHRLLMLDPAHDRGRLSLARILVEIGEQREAMDHLRQFLARHPEHGGALGTLGYLEVETGDYESAAGHLKLAIEQDPSDATARLNLATALHKRGRHSEAIEQYEQVLRSKPEWRAASRGLSAARRAAHVK